MQHLAKPLGKLAAVGVHLREPVPEHHVDQQALLERLAKVRPDPLNGNKGHHVGWSDGKNHGKNGVQLMPLTSAANAAVKVPSAAIM